MIPFPQHVAQAPQPLLASLPTALSAPEGSYWALGSQGGWAAIGKHLERRPQPHVIKVLQLNGSPWVPSNSFTCQQALRNHQLHILI